MRRLALLALLLCAVSAGQARANAFGQMIPASPLYGGNNLFGGYLLFGDRVGNDVGLLGQVRLSSSPKFDWGLQFGYAGSDPSQILIGGDIRPVLHAANDDFPLDLAFDAGVGLSIADHFTILDVVPSIEGSHKFDLSGASSTPPTTPRPTSWPASASSGRRPGSSRSWPSWVSAIPQTISSWA
jgi:hypothetical protein